jgi:hypothetical protein
MQQVLNSRGSTSVVLPVCKLREYGVPVGKCGHTLQKQQPGGL